MVGSFSFPFFIFFFFSDVSSFLFCFPPFIVFYFSFSSPIRFPMCPPLWCSFLLLSNLASSSPFLFYFPLNSPRTNILNFSASATVGASIMMRRCKYLKKLVYVPLMFHLCQIPCGAVGRHICFSWLLWLACVMYCPAGGHHWQGMLDRFPVSIYFPKKLFT